MRVSTCRFLPPLPVPPCLLVPPCPPTAPQIRVVVFLQGIRCACGCRPSCCLFGVDVVVVHHAVLFIVGFESLPVQGRCCRNLDLTLLCSFYCRRCYCNVLDSSLCRTARWGIKDPSFHIMFVYHVTWLGVSRSKEIQLEICRSLHIYNRICFELSMFFW